MTTSPNLVTGKPVVVMMMPTRETAPFLVHELQEYRGLVVVYGETQRHGVVVARGIRGVTGRDGMFVYVPNGNANEIEEFCRAIGGRRIGMVFVQSVSLINKGQTAVPEESRYYPVINGPIPSWFGPYIQYSYITGQPRPVVGQKNKQMDLGRVMIDLWWEWQAATPKQLPAWALLQKSIHESRRN